MTDLRQRFLREFGDGECHELEDLEILFSLDLSPDESFKRGVGEIRATPLNPETLLQAMERSGIVIERCDVTIDLGAPDDVSGEWVEDLVPTPGFRVIIKK